MKLSRYNFLLRVDGQSWLCYNALTNGFAAVGEECAEVLRNFSPEKYFSLPEETRKELERGGFVVAPELDERDVLKVRLRAAQYWGNSLGLVICPTLLCNLACTYCFESNFKGRMTEDVQDGVVNFARSLLPPVGGSLDVTWYGGEPLLGLEIIEALTGKLRQLCEERKATYRAGVITNGTLLTGNTAARLKALGVQHAQVTLDGPPSVHDVRRPFLSGAPSFQRIVDNLKEAAPALPISLRINVDRQNVDQALDFVEWLISREWFNRETMTLHFGYVRKSTPSCGCGLDDMLKPREFWELTKKMEDRLAALGLFSPVYPAVIATCTAISSKGFVIGPRGELYRCWSHVGDESMACGTVFAPAWHHPLYVQYLLRGFEDDPECMECAYLPLCGGGCVDVRVKASEGLLPGKDCAQWRYSLADRLQQYLRWWWQRGQEEKSHEA